MVKTEGSQCGGTLNNMVKEDLSQVTFNFYMKTDTCQHRNIQSNIPLPQLHTGITMGALNL